MMGGIKLIVGLGNPGDEYSKTRHNAGFWLVEHIADKYGVSFALENKFFGQVAKFKHCNEDIFLLKPQTFMNLSAKAVQALASFYKILPVQIMVVHDELDFAPGIVKLKQGGGTGGHNGLKDIDRLLGSNYWRLRLGIGHPGVSSKVTGYVLKKPALDDLILINEAIDKVDRVLSSILNGDFATAMKLLHTK